MDTNNPPNNPPAGDPPPSGGDNWRTPFAGTDPKRAQAMERFTTPNDFAESYFKAQERIRSGDVLKPLPADATEDDIKSYREQQGIPLDPKEYLSNLPDGLVIGEVDLPVFEEFATVLHGLHASPAQVHGAIKWYNELEERTLASRHENEEKLKTVSEDTFREEWGSDYRKNTNLINALIDGQFGDGAESVRNAMLSTGNPLMSDSNVLRGLINISRVINPTGVLIDSEIGDQITSMETELDALKKEMRANIGAWHKNTKGQERFQLLVNAIDVQNKRSQSK